jgi:hypothetical protein
MASEFAWRPFHCACVELAVAAPTWNVDQNWVIPPAADAPAAFTAAQAQHLRDQLGTDNCRSRRKAFNLAIKFARKANARADGRPTTFELDVTATEEWLIPQFVYHGKGQLGAWDFDQLMVFNWRAVLAQLSEADFRLLFALAGPEPCSVLKVAFVVVGKQGRWFAFSGAADYELMIWTATAVVTMRGSSKGDLAVKFHDRGELVEQAGQGQAHQQGRQRKWHSTEPANGFLYGGAEDGG